MKSMIRLMLGLLAALGMVALIFGALLLSLSEDPAIAQAFSAPTSPVNPTSASSPVTPPPGITLVVLSPVPSATEQPATTLCPSPPGWQPYTVRAGDQLDELAESAGVSTDELIKANCMISPNLISDAILYLPPSHTITPSLTITVTDTAVQNTLTFTPRYTSSPRATCRAPAGWILYTVQSGDTLYKISQAYGVTVNQIQQANCLSGTNIQAGWRIYVPNVPTQTPVIVATRTFTRTTVPPTPTQTSAPSSTNTVVTVTPLPSLTPTPTDTSTVTPVTPTETNTEIPTVASNTATTEPSPSPSPSLTLTDTTTTP